jgi:hypothetical protein
MRQRGPLRALAATAGLAFAILTTSCGIPTDHSAQTSATRAPSNAARRTASPPFATPRAEVVLFLKRNERLAPYAEIMVTPFVPLEVARRLAIVPSDAPRGTGSDITPSTVERVDLVADTATVDVHGAGLPNTPAARTLAFGQLLWTLTGLNGITKVRFLVDGKPYVPPRTRAVSATGALTRADDAALVP